MEELFEEIYTHKIFGCPYSLLTRIDDNYLVCVCGEKYYQPLEWLKNLKKQWGIIIVS
jgi:hypothetical protein